MNLADGEIIDKLNRGAWKIETMRTLYKYVVDRCKELNLDIQVFA